MKYKEISYFKRNIKMTALIILAITIVSFIAYDYVNRSNITLEEEKETKNICNNLQIPPSFIKVHQIDLVKNESVVCSTNYSSTAKPEEVEEYFVESLKKSG